MSEQYTKAACWRDFVHVRPRYLRSVHLERDARAGTSLDGYILTPLVRTLARRIVDSYGAATPSRAWSITGPYGTGKSAFALFLSQIFSPPSLCGEGPRRILTTADEALAGAMTGPGGIFKPDAGLFPVLATGERSPLDQVLLRALSEAAQHIWHGRGKKPKILGTLAKLADKAAKGRSVPVREVVEIFEEVARTAKKSTLPGRGLLVVLDEAGKILEHAAQQPDRGDVQLLQELAEAANRSGDAPIVFVVLLHQAFEQYAGRLSLTERGEWSKVQGRFEDLAFQEASQELLRLVGEALDRESLPKAVHKKLAPLAASSAELVVRGGQQDAKSLAPLLDAALPLHPVTALLLGPLFRSRIAQNERSLFAFLSSMEPAGFQEFLARPLLENGRPVLFLPDALYDYVVGSLGGHLHGHLGKQWAQVDTALRRLPEGAGELDARLVKTIGLLGLFGDAAGLSASEATLRALYADDSEASQRALREALERLSRASLIIFRKFRNAFQIWEGSDIDVDASVRDALSQVSAGSSLVPRLDRVAPPRPVVARRHLFKTGTFRYFELRYVDASAFVDSLPPVDANADGAVFLVVETSDAMRSKLAKQLAQPMMWFTTGEQTKPVVVAVPRYVGRLLEAGAELAALEWVHTHTPALQDDPVARREVVTRIAEAERQLREEIAKILGGAVDCDWFEQGKSVDVSSFRDLTRVASDLCDIAYSKAPHVHNELLNRRQISSSAAAARRSLLEAMVTNGDKEQLGFEGTPPEVSMYRSLLEAHRLHRKRGGQLCFGPPKDKPEGSLLPAWKAIEDALDDAHEARLRVPEIFERLRKPPYGLKDGVMPVLLVAAMLAWKEETALYEDGAFVPTLNGAVIERMLKAPEKYEVQRLSIKGPREVLFHRLAQMLSMGSSADAPGLVTIVRQLVRVVRDLTEYARITKTVSPRAQAVREALLRAREPAPLLFRDLPVACGRQPFEARGTLPEAEAETFVEELRGAIRELRLAYTKLLDTIEDAIRTGLSLPNDRGDLRRELAMRSSRLLPVAVDAQLKAFLLRAGEADMPHEEWLVSVGTLLGGKPPEYWHDRDIDQARLTLGLICRRFASLESMVTVAEAEAELEGLPLLRVAITQPGQVERERVVPLRPEDEPMVKSVSHQLREIAEQAAASLPREAIVAALALVARDMISELNERGQADAPEVNA